MSDLPPNPPPSSTPSQTPYRHSSKTPWYASPVGLTLVLLAVLLAGIAIGHFWSKAGNDTATSPAHATAEQDRPADGGAIDKQIKPVLTVETVSPKHSLAMQHIAADGVIAGKDVARVSAKVNGVAVQQVLVEVGDSVQAGQVLAVLDTDAMQQQTIQAEADLAEAQASLANAEADLARVMPLLEIDAISRQQVDSYQTAAVRARAALTAAKARLSNQQLNIRNAKLTAPVAGVISERHIEVGSVVGGEPLFAIIKNGVLEWQASLEPRQMTDVTIGGVVQVSLPNQQRVTGRISRIAPTADDSRQVRVYATLQPNRHARAGMYQRGELLLGESSQQTLPSTAIVSSDGYDNVMMLTDTRNQDGKTLAQIQQQRVQVGERLGADVVVLTDLPSDSQIVKQGGSFLHDGDWVQVQP